MWQYALQQQQQQPACHSLSQPDPTLTKPWCLDGHHIQDATQLVDNQGGQRLACRG